MPGTPEIREAVILAAGMGTRLNCGPDMGGERPKPLLELGDKPILRWVLEAIARVGIERAVLVVGWRGDMVRDYVRANPVPGLAVDFAQNDEWKKSNGVSLLKARDHVKGSFLLMMSDHVFEDRLAAGLVASDAPAGGVRLAIDRRIAEVFDLDDATKVRTDAEGRIVAIGKELDDYDAVDCGLFACSQAAFEALEASKVDGDCSISDGMRRLAGEGRFLAHDIGDAFWQDVDTPDMFDHALAQLRRLTTAA